jgi:hypothetical protein
MSIEKIIAEAIENNPLKLKEAFEEEMNARVRAALEEKYKEMTTVSEEAEAIVEGEESDEDEGDDEEVAKEMKKMHKDGAEKADVLKAVKEKYGCSGDKAEGLYASNCTG